MDRHSFEAALEPGRTRKGMRRLSRRFNYAFRQTRDLENAMGAVNELLDHPMTYHEFYSTLRAE